MSIVSLWEDSPEQVRHKLLHQIISFAGEGRLRDGNATSAEFRAFLRSIPSDLLIGYARACLEAPFPDSGLALQDLVNEIGLRLGFAVEHGRYRGNPNTIGFDGLWQMPEDHGIVVEVKTTDTYRILLDTVAGYRKRLIESGRLDPERSSMLVVVGREDTGDLEAQIRGSRHAWETRLISVEALIRLLETKEELEDPQAESRVRSILVPREYTRVDEIIDLVFSTTEDLKQEAVDIEDGPEIGAGGEQHPTPVDFHQSCADRVARELNLKLLRRSRASFSTPDGTTAVHCAVSKEHGSESGGKYWFAFYPYQQERLEKAQSAFVALGCGSPAKVVLLELEDFAPLLEGMHQTHRDDGKSYWHVLIYEEEGRLVLHRRKEETYPDLTDRLIDS